MNEQPVPVDVAQMARDDELLAALGRGDPPPDGDDLAVLLASWRSDLSSASVVDVRRRSRPRFRAVFAAAAVVLGVIGALTVAAGSAGPDSPLWPITRIVYEDRADSRLAQRDAELAIERARSLVAESRRAEASALLDEATAAIGRVRDPRIARRLLDEVRAVRDLLATVGGTTTVPAPGGAGPSPGSTPPSGNSGATPQPGTTPGAGGAPTLPVPPLPLPTLPVPIPSLPTLPPVLPPVLPG